MSEQCALCTDTKATTRLEDTGLLGSLLVQDSPADVRYGEVVIPLCEDCRPRIDDALAAYASYGGPDEKQRAEERLQRYARKMNSVIIENASGH